MLGVEPQLQPQQAQLMYAFRQTRDYLARMIEDKKVSHLAKADIRKAHHHICLWLNDFNLRVMSSWWPMNTYSFKDTVKMILNILEALDVSGMRYHAGLIRAAMRNELHFDMEETQGVSTSIVVQGSMSYEEYVQALEEKGG